MRFTPIAILCLISLPAGISAHPAEETLEKLVVTGRREHLAAEELEEIVVRGDRDLLSQDLMQTLSVRAADSTTQVSQNRTIGDWLAAEPGISLNGQGGLLQSYSLRGMSRSRIRTEVDGVPIITDRAAGNSASFLPPSLLHAVNAQMGGSSSLFGSDAMGGVVSVQTRQFAQLNVEGAFQSLDNASALTIGGAPRNDTSVGLTFRTADNATAANGTPLNTRYRQAAAVLQHERVWQTLKLGVSGLLSRGNEIGKSSRDYPGSMSRYPFERHGILKLELERSNQWLLRLYGHRQEWQTTTQVGNPSLAINSYRSDTVGSLFYLTYSALGGPGRAGIEWVGRRGVTVRYQEQGTAGEMLIDSEPVSGRQDNLGLFFDQQWTQGVLDAGVGLRFDHIAQKARTGDASHAVLSTNVRLNWHISERATFFARWATGFRAPTLGELYYRGVTPRGDIVGNAELDPEDSTTSELGLAVTPDRFSFSLAVYRTVIDDYFERFQKTATTRSYRNIGEGVIRGYEIHASYKPTARWTHGLSYGHQSGHNSISGAWLADLNPNTWRYNATWRPSRAIFSLDISHRERRSKFGPGEEPLDAMTLVNVAVSWPVSQQWELGLACTNCADQRFFVTADDRAALQPGRAIEVNFAWKPRWRAPKYDAVK